MLASWECYANMGCHYVYFMPLVNLLPYLQCLNVAFTEMNIFMGLAVSYIL